MHFNIDTRIKQMEGQCLTFEYINMVMNNFGFDYSYGDSEMLYYECVGCGEINDIVFKYEIVNLENSKFINYSYYITNVDNPIFKR